MTVTQSIPARVPRTSGPRCTLANPATLHPCTRAAGHRGRHHFTWIHTDGRVREVWGSR